MTPELLTTFLSSLHQTFRDRISSVLLIPLTTAIVTLVFLHGSTQGWEWYTSLWKDTGSVERAMLVGVVAFGVLFLAAALDALISPINRVFERGPFGYAQWATNQYRKQWDDLYEQKMAWECLYRTFYGKEDSWFSKPEDPPAGAVVSDPAPDPSWRTGMRLLTLTVPDDHLAHKLEAGQAVNLWTDANPEVLPGGVLVTAVSPTTDEETIDGRAVNLRQITIATPHDAVREIAAIPTERVFVGRRSTPDPTPFWDPGAGWTRRWIVPATGGAVGEPETGDLLILKLANDAVTLTATFCERIDNRWVVALREDELGPNLDALRNPASPSTWTRGTARVPILTEGVNAWTALPPTIDHEIPVLRGTISILGTDYRSDELILASDPLANRYSTAKIEARSAIPKSRISAAGDLRIVRWNDLWGPQEPDAGRFCHFRETKESTTNVHFNCRMLTNSQMAIPDKPGLTDDARLLYSNGGALPESPSDKGGLAPWTWHDVMEQPIEVWSIPKVGTYDVVIIPAMDSPQLSEPMDAIRQAVTPPDDPDLTSGPVPPSAIPAIIINESEPTSNVVKVLAKSMVAKGPWTIDGSYIEKRSEGLIGKDGALWNATTPAMALDVVKRLRTLVEMAHGHLTLDAAFQPARGLRTDLTATASGSEGQRVCETIQYWVDQSREELTLTMPLNRNLTVGTEFGNIVQTITSYGHEAYGMHTPLTLPRIIAKVSADTRKPLDAAKEQISLLQWSFIASLVVAVAGSLMLLHDGAPLWIPILLYLVAGIAIPWACLSGLRSAGLTYAAEAKFLMDSQRGLVLDALGINRPVDEDGKMLIRQERMLWNAVGQWLEYGTDDHTINVPTYTLPPTGGASGSEEPKA